MVKEIKSLVLWVILTLIAVLFAMASSGNTGTIRYAYFFVAIISCYLIRVTAKTVGATNGK